MNILCVANQKGGVGKTTIAIHLAVGLSMAGFRTLLVDCDYQASASLGLRVEPEPTQTLAAWLPWHHAKPGIKQTHYEGLDVLPAFITMAWDEETAAQRQIDPIDIANKLQTVYANDYDWMVLDAPPSIASFWAKVAYVTAERVLIPITPGPFPLAGFRQLMNWIDTIRTRNINPHLRVIGIVENMVEAQTTYGKAIDELLHDMVSDDLIFATRIPKAAAIVNAQGVGETALESSAKLGDVFYELTKEVLDKWPKVNRP